MYILYSSSEEGKMSKKSIVACCVISLFVFVSWASTDDTKMPSNAEKSSDVKTSGIIFLRYDYDYIGTDKGKGFNKIDIERTYLTFESSIAGNAKVKVVTDIYQNAKSLIVKDIYGNDVKISSYYDGWSVRLKNAYVDINPLHLITIRAGMLGSPWISVAEKAWCYRFVKKTFSDAEKLFDTADLGAGLIFKLPKDYGEAMLAVLNGTGYTSPESDKFKDINPRITLVPLPNNKILKGLSLSGYYYLGKRSDNEKILNRNRVGALLSFTNSLVNIGGEFDASNNQKLNKSKNIEDENGMGFSIYGELKFAELAPTKLKNLGLIVRFDSWDPNTDIENDAHNTLIAGLIYTLTKNVRSAINLQQTSFEDSENETKKQISCQVEVKF